METKPRSRRNYRTAPPGTLTHYLIHLYPKGLDYQRGYHGAPTQLHDTSTDQGRFIGTDSMGQLEYAHAFFNQINGYPWEWFRDALEEIRAMDGGAVPGRYLVMALEWHQKADLNKARGYTARRLAYDLGVDRGTVTRWLYECVDLVRTIVFSPRD